MVGIEILMIGVAASMVIRAVRGGARGRFQPYQPPPALPAPDPRVEQLQAEVDDLRSQVERLHAAEQFYAQLQAPASPAAVQPPPAAPQPTPPPEMP